MTTATLDAAHMLATLINNAARIREASFNHTSTVGMYDKTMYDAVAEACGGDDAIFIDIVHALLVTSWNEALAWARTYSPETAA